MDGTTTLNPAPMPRPVEDLILPALDSGRYLVYVARIDPDPAQPGQNLLRADFCTVDFPTGDFPAAVLHLRDYLSAELRRIHGQLVPTVPVVPVVDESPSEPVADGDAYLVQLLAKPDDEPAGGYDCRYQDVRGCARCGGDHDQLVFRKTTPGNGEHYWANCPTNGEIIGLRIRRISEHTTIYEGTAGMYSDLPLGKG